MKKMNKKGFTIVELVIVIAVIAILAAVLIPTFSGVVSKANQSAAMQAARNEYTEYMTTLDSKIGTGNYVIEATQGNNTFYFAVKDGQFDSTAYTTEATAKTAAGITTALDKTDLSIVYTATEVKSSDLEDHAATYKAAASGAKWAANTYFTDEEGTAVADEAAFNAVTDKTTLYVVDEPAVAAKAAVYYEGDDALKYGFEKYLAASQDATTAKQTINSITVTAVSNRYDATLEMESSNGFTVTITYTDGQLSYEVADK